MENSYDITYSYRFEDGTEKIFTTSLNRETLRIIREKVAETPAWTELSNDKCEICTLDEASHKYCPVALNMADIVLNFKDYFAYENVRVTVTTEERTYMKDTTIQMGLSALIGIIMTTSGCPVLKFLKPMVRFHLPFATIEESIYRLSSMYLISRYFLNKDGRGAGCSLEGLQEIYGNVCKVNAAFAQRLSDAAKKDANVNALVNLDCFANMALAADEVLEDIRPFFSAYLE